MNYLLERGFTILSVTIDGKKGIKNVFKDYLVQICQFHIQAGVSTLITKNPKTEAGRALKKINNAFIQKRQTEQELGSTLAQYVKEYQDYLSELNDKGEYKHQRLRKALKKFKNNLPDLCTYLKYPDLNLPNTTNHIDGGVNPQLKNLVWRHRGMNINRRNKLLAYFLKYSR